MFVSLAAVADLWLMQELYSRHSFLYFKYSRSLYVEREILPLLVNMRFWDMKESACEGV